MARHREWSAGIWAGIRIRAGETTLCTLCTGEGETRRRINSAKVAATTQTRGVSPHHTPRTDRTLSRGTRNPLPNKKVHVLSARASDFEWPYRDERSLFTFWRAIFLAGVFVCGSALPGEFRVTQGVSFCLDAGLHRATRVGNSQ